MALKAYKHLTDGEVKIVNEGSAEETSLLADTVTGSSYLQLTSTGHSQEVAAAQGTALWVDVTSDLGSGGGGGLPTGMDYQVFEVTDLLIPAGTDWSANGHVLGTVTYSRARLPTAKMFISVDSVAAGDSLYLAPCTNPNLALATADTGPVIAGPATNQAASYYLPDAFSGQVDLSDAGDIEFSIVIATFRSGGVTAADMHVTASAAFLTF
jgi:hypothetical protein